MLSAQRSCGDGDRLNQRHDLQRNSFDETDHDFDGIAAPSRWRDKDLGERRCGNEQPIPALDRFTERSLRSVVMRIGAIKQSDAQKGPSSWSFDGSG